MSVLTATPFVAPADRYQRIGAGAFSVHDQLVTAGTISGCPGRRRGCKVTHASKPNQR
jgi:hypothetical protein